MAAFNKVILIGNLCADPELKTTANGISVTSFNLAVARRKTAKGQEPQTDFFPIVAWRGTAEFISKFFNKGKSILIVGSLQTRSWTDNDGNKRYVTEVVADEAQFVEKKSDSSAENTTSASPYATAKVAFEEQTADEDLPF